MSILSILGVAVQSTRSLGIEGSVGKLAAELQLPELSGYGKCHMVIMSHRFTSNVDSPLLRELADDLVRSGIGVLCFDFNGHRKSEGEFQNMTVLNEIEDLKKVIEWTMNQPFTADISHAGHY